MAYCVVLPTMKPFIIFLKGKDQSGVRSVGTLRRYLSEVANEYISAGDDEKLAKEEFCKENLSFYACCGIQHYESVIRRMGGTYGCKRIMRKDCGYRFVTKLEDETKMYDDVPAKLDPLKQAALQEYVKELNTKLAIRNKRQSIELQNSMEKEIKDELNSPALNLEQLGEQRRHLTGRALRNIIRQAIDIKHLTKLIDYGRIGTTTYDLRNKIIRASDRYMRDVPLMSMCQLIALLWCTQCPTTFVRVEEDYDNKTCTMTNKNILYTTKVYRKMKNINVCFAIQKTSGMEEDKSDEKGKKIVKKKGSSSGLNQNIGVWKMIVNSLGLLGDNPTEEEIKSQDITSENLFTITTLEAPPGKVTWDDFDKLVDNVGLNLVKTSYYNWAMSSSKGR
ncbi:uncharacterized protein LOC126835952 [Adelges cooleyi]|uniref:uncharacterized protein LOC126835952 n=1 Tax=Adelges cooleyi TaxID=133065 RepID=UPI00217F63C9|nr:uncharacterized protein LOC126835952 [Adelges cooleyi]